MDDTKKQQEEVKDVKKISKAKTKAAEEMQFYAGNGRRKTATATARLYPFTTEVVVQGKKLERGEIYVNGKSASQYFPGPYAKEYLAELFRTTNASNRFITTAIVVGSGPTGQIGAVGLAIARALVLVDPKLKTTLRKKGYITRDPRSKERKKPGLMGARKEKQSPKR